jgi:hypothetical protein
LRLEKGTRFLLSRWSAMINIFAINFLVMMPWRKLADASHPS